MSEVSFKEVATDLLSRARILLPDWLPGGKIEGNEFACGSLQGEPGNSLKVNVSTGLWADFASTEKGGDLISLYAAIKNISQLDALKHFSPQRKEPNTFKFLHPTRKIKPVKVWEYFNPDSTTSFWVARYEYTDENGERKKTFTPWHKVENKFISKRPRYDNLPLYGVHLIGNGHSEKPILIVEGEKAADAATEIAGRTYQVVTWNGGASGVSKSDWTPLHGRKILIVPDLDFKTATPGEAKKFDINEGDQLPKLNQPGMSAAMSIARKLYDHCPEIKIVDPYLDLSESMSDGWDLADALNEGWDYKKFISWAKPRVKVFNPPEPTAAIRVSFPVETEPHLNVIEGEVMPDDYPYSDDDTPIIRAEVSEPSIQAPYNVSSQWLKLGLIPTHSKKADPQPIIENVRRCFEGLDVFKNHFWYDEFHAKIFTDWDGPAREIKDIDDVAITGYLQRNLWMFKLRPEVVRSVIYLEAAQHVRNEPKEWLESLVWDGVPRCGQFFMDAFDCEDNHYLYAVAKNWWISMAARIYKPGCKADNMVVLEAKQGKLKSTALSIIGGKWFAEVKDNMASKDFFLAIQGKLLVEVSELGSFSKTDVRAIKATLSCQFDRFRPPYARNMTDFPRQCIFVGTTNEQEYLQDDTGGRRFWPVKVNHISLEYIKDNRDQLFAEAVALFKQGAPWYEMPQAHAEAEQELRRETDIWEEPVRNWLLGKSKVSINEIAESCLTFNKDQLDRRVRNRVASILKTLGWNNQPCREGSQIVKRWVSPTWAGPTEMFPQSNLKNYAENITREEMN